LFPTKLVLERCYQWWKDVDGKNSISVDVLPLLYTHLLTDNVRAIVLYGAHNVAVYDLGLQLVWQQQYEKEIVLGWLSQSGLYLFLLKADNSLLVVDRCDGKTVVALAGGAIDMLSTSATRQVVAKNSIDGTGISFYIVSQEVGAGDTKNDDSQQRHTLVQCVTLERLKETEVGQQQQIRPLVKKPRVAQVSEVIVQNPELTLAELK